MRKYDYEYPDYTAELDKLNSFPKGSAEYVDELPRVLKRIIEKHRFNAEHTKALHNRYKVMDDAVPIFKRKPRFPNSVAPINHKVNNDFFGEIVDFFTGCFGGLKYAYSDTDESKRETGDIGRAAKCLSDFVTENTMRDKDNEVKKLASICGYVGRLMYHDRNGRERVAIIPAYQVAVLSEDELTSPLYGLRYYKTKKYDGKTEIVAEFYDGDHCYFLSGGSPGSLKIQDVRETLFGGLCPLQIIPKNAEFMGDAENVLTEIDAYDRAVSDTSNEIDNFTNAILAFKNMAVDEDSIDTLRKGGSISFASMSEGDSGPYYVTKDINDAYIEHHLDRLRSDIYRFSKTPNLSDGSFGAESGEARKFRIAGIEAKCNMFQGKLELAGAHMFRLLEAAYTAKNIAFSANQCFIEFSRNMPKDTVSEAQAVATLIAAGLPREVAFSTLSFVDDVDYIMQLLEEEEAGIPPLDLDD